MDEDKGLAPRTQTDEIASGALAPGSEEQAHSKSEYKRRVAQGDTNVLPPEPCTLPDCSCPVVGGLPQCRGAAAACGVRVLPADGWHAPGIGEVHSADHGLMLFCMKANPDAAFPDYLPDDELAERVAAMLNAAGVLGTGSAAGHSTNEFSNLSTQAHAYGVDLPDGGKR